MRTTTLHAGGAARRSSPDGATGLGSVSAGRPASPHVSELPLPAKAKPGTSNVTSQPLEPGAGSTRTSCRAAGSAANAGPSMAAAGIARRAGAA